MTAVTYGYARVSKADDESKNLDTQLLLLAEHGLRSDLILSDVAIGRNLQRTGWQKLMARIQEGDTTILAFLDQLYRNLEDGVYIQAELAGRNISIVAIREKNDTREASAAAKFFRQSMLAQGAYQVKSTSERIKAGLERVRAEGKRPGHPPAHNGEGGGVPTLMHVGGEPANPQEHPNPEGLPKDSQTASKRDMGQ